MTHKPTLLFVLAMALTAFTACQSTPPSPASVHLDSPQAVSTATALAQVGTNLIADAQAHDLGTLHLGITLKWVENEGYSASDGSTKLYPNTYSDGTQHRSCLNLASKDWSVVFFSEEPNSMVVHTDGIILVHRPGVTISPSWTDTPADLVKQTTTIQCIVED